MGILHDESHLPDLLLTRKLINADQRALIAKKRAQQLTLLKNRQQHRRRTDGQPAVEIPPDMVDVILSLAIETAPGKPLIEEMVVQSLADSLGIPFKKLDPLDLDLEVVTKTIPKSFALKHLLLPFGVKNGELQVAIYDPDNRQVLEEIERANKLKIQVFLSTKSDIRKMLTEFFGFQSSISAAESHLGGPGVDLGNLEQYVRIASSEEIASSDQHIKSAVDHMFNYAFDQRASDIHIEPKREKSMVRLRIDGVLHTIYNLPRVVHPAIISRVKTLARMDIAEKRRPQDGRIKVDRSGKEAEIRVSTVPVAFGEKAVLRILDPDIIFRDLDDVGFCDRDLAVYKEMLRAPHGIVLVTGPTGSGKSTTLYSTLKFVATPDKNIITVEDPVEMIYDEFNQIAVQTQVDVTFATILRNILRQDPDIIMIGEIRDRETATHAIQAALTGHQVFSTLHTNDAVSSVSRLLDLGIQPFFVGSTLLGAMAQRLVRKICPNCAETYKTEVDGLRGLGLPVRESGRITLRRGKGCRDCRGTGFLGRCGIFEIFPMSDSIRSMVSAAASEADIRKGAQAEGMTTLLEDAWRKVRGGITTVEESIRVVGAG